MKDRFSKFLAQLPPSYIAFIEEHNGWEGDLGENLGYVVLWAKETIQERYDAYEMALYLRPHWFPFGSNGGGEMLCFDLRSDSDRVFWMPYLGMSDDEAMLRYDSFADIAQAIARSM
ncbi:MAG: SMI1/KNR4 family protein [Planctomycetes bacterium]|nr:SMI1/KNR4 family protein [Planctomycetota bacterium]